MFSDLKKGFEVYTLDVNDVPVFNVGKVVAVSDARFIQPRPGDYSTLQQRVVDITIEIDGQNRTYTVPEGQNVAKAAGITLSTTMEPIMNELTAIKRNAEEVIQSVEQNKKKISACDKIMEEVNPMFKQTREQDRKIEGIENKVNNLTNSFEDLKKLIVERLK